MVFVVMLCLFCVRFAGVSWHPYRRFAVAFAVLVAPVLYVANALGVIGETTVYVRLAGIALVAVALAAVARYAFRLRNVESLLLLATGATATAFALHDWMLAQDPFTIRPLWLVPYSAFAFLVLVGWILIDRFVRALNEYERLNADLERRIAAKSASLEFQLEETRQAKNDAETANRAKSRFLAAASHDLRQPLHALGMFAAALPETTLDAESTGLVQRIKTSVASLEALLSALLDISRLDAGVVSAEKRDMWLDGLFQRLANDFVPEAIERGLRLAIVPTKCVVHSDPVLLDRIMRNLVANALRYTTSGGAVIGARRRGNQISIEVWDSGSGIDDTERERIFEEFYQTGNPGRDRARGLGLGLAIVRRSADLLGHKVELASRVGRGSVFRVIVDAGNSDTLLAAVSAQPSVTGSMAGHCLVVIDDETLVRESTRDLLVSWGAAVIAGADAEDVLAALDGTMPSLLLVDYRLRDGRDGLGAIGRLRESLGWEIPAVLISGESSTAELARIKASGLLLLHKPVPPAKLRSAVAFLLRASPEPSQSTVE
jgi:signal transduction histidine kinase/CheY-like chemotaxis protein